MHTTTLEVEYVYEGGTEGETVIQWERSKEGSVSFETIPKANKKIYIPTLDDAEHNIRAVCTPARDDWVKGVPSATESILLVMGWLCSYVD